MTENDVSIENIVNYWSSRESECGLGADWAEAHERCWRCGYKSTLQRCHIVPRALGGSDEPSNLVLLCHRCHREAPNISDPRFMWIWIRATCVPFYDTYWVDQGTKEFEKMFNRKPFQGSKFEKIGLSKNKIHQFIEKEIKNTVIHFGEGSLNPATVACIFARIEERLIGRPITPFFNEL